MIIDKLGRGAKLFLIGSYLVGLIGLAGCATTSELANNNIGYEEFFDSYGDYKLVGRNNDVYMEKLDGSESKKITHTPGIKEGDAFFVEKGKYIVYFEWRRTPSFGDNKRYIQKTEGSWEERREINGAEYSRYFNEWQERVK